MGNIATFATPASKSLSLNHISVTTESSRNDGEQPSRITEAQWRRRWGPRGHWPPRLVSKCGNFGQIDIIWAILHQNFGKFHIFRANLYQNFGHFNIHQTVSISVKTFFLFVFGGHLNSDRKNRFNFSEDLFFWRSP